MSFSPENGFILENASSSTALWSTTPMGSGMGSGGEDMKWKGSARTWVVKVSRRSFISSSDSSNYSATRL